MQRLVLSLCRRMSVCQTKRCRIVNESGAQNKLLGTQMQPQDEMKGILIYREGGQSAGLGDLIMEPVRAYEERPGWALENFAAYNKYTYIV